MNEVKYSLYIAYDNGPCHIATVSNRLRPLYEEAAYYFDSKNARAAYIYRGKKMYKYKLHNSQPWGTIAP